MRARSLRGKVPSPLRVRAASVTVALECLRRKGFDDTAACRAVGLREDDLTPGDRLIELRAAVALYETCARLSGDDHFGLHLGASGGHGLLGDLSYAVRHAPTVGAALRNLVRFVGVVSPGIGVALVVDGGEVRLTYDVPDPAVWPRRQDVEASAASVVRLLRAMLGEGWAPRAVHFEHAAPADRAPYAKVLGGAVRFAQPGNAIVLDAAALDTPVGEADPHLLQIVERHLSAALAEAPRTPDADPLVQSVREEVERALPSGDLGIDAVARRLCVSPRTLQRRLGERGVGFRELVDEVRRGLALRHLRGGDGALTELAFRLGYSELSAFDRAFRRWTGTSPQRHGREEGARGDV